MKLRVEFARADGGWTAPTPYITDGQLEFFLDPNQVGALRVRGVPDWPSPWIQFDMARLALIYDALVKAHESAEVKS